MSNFPNIPYQIADPSGFITPPWRDAFNRLWALAAGGDAMANRALIDPTQLGVTPSVLVTGGANNTRLDKVTVTNTSAGARTVNAYLVPVGRSPDDTTQVAFDVAVPVGSSVDLDTVAGHVLNKNWTLQMSADTATSVTVAISGVPFT